MRHQHFLIETKITVCSFLCSERPTSCLSRVSMQCVHSAILFYQFCPSVCLSVCQVPELCNACTARYCFTSSVCLSVCPTVCLSVYCFTSSVRLSVCPSVLPSVCPSVCLSVCLSVLLSVCLSACPSVRCRNCAKRMDI